MAFILPSLRGLLGVEVGAAEPRPGHRLREPRLPGRIPRREGLEHPFLQDGGTPVQAGVAAPEQHPRGAVDLVVTRVPARPRDRGCELRAFPGGQPARPGRARAQRRPGRPRTERQQPEHAQKKDELDQAEEHAQTLVRRRPESAHPDQPKHSVPTVARAGEQDDSLEASAARGLTRPLADGRLPAGGSMSAPSSINQSLRIPVADVALDADLGVPENPRGAVLFAHGSGSARHSPRNRQVAAELNRAGLVTVLADLLTAEEEQVDLRTTALRFDIDLLAARLTALVDWVTRSRPTAGRGIGVFGASTGAAAALIAAADRPTTVQAVVSRGGRADLAGTHLREVRQPTLLIVGERDPVVIDLNRQAMRALRGETRLVVVPGASHLFEEPGTLQQVAHLARDWFVGRLEPAPADGKAG